MLTRPENQDLQQDALWDEFRGGCELAYARIYERYVPVLYSYGSRLTADKELVKDCLQDLFVTLWNSRSQLGPTDSIKFYLFRALRREVAGKQNRLPLSLPDAVAGTQDSCEDQWIATETDTVSRRSLDKAMAGLSDRQREAIYLRFYENMGFDQIATILEITPRAVYKLIYRAIDTLQKYYHVQPFPDQLHLEPHLLALLLVISLPAGLA